MSSVQTGQLISLLINNVLMVVMVMAVTLAAWLRWQWLQTAVGRTRVARRRCRWAYVSFVLTAVTLLGMLVSLGILALRAIVAVNALVMGAMGIFLLSVITLLMALGLWLVDLCFDFPALSVARRTGRGGALKVPSIALLPAAISVGHPRRLSRRAQRRQRR
ncbi:MAG: hypothetical protein AAGA46_04825 [Cyanobacteria bacterium P01_F01_bin.13]